MSLISSLRKTAVFYLVVVGVLVHLSLLPALYFGLRYYQLTPGQAYDKVMALLGYEQPLVKVTDRYDNHPLDGLLTLSHPRILLPELATDSTVSLSLVMRQRLGLYTDKNSALIRGCGGNSLQAHVSCWLTTGNLSSVDAAVEKMRNFGLQTPNANGNYGNGWELALAYDLLYNSIIDINARQQIEAKIQHALGDFLRILNDESPSLWHGRSTLAASAWLCALALDPSSEPAKTLIRRAQGHFLETVRSLALTEAWPEGYNYWIQNRGFKLALALSGYVQGIEGGRYRTEVRDILENMALWPVYAMRPDGRAEALGDEGSRVDLKDETRRVIDVAAQVTRSATLATFSEFLGNLHGAESYYQGYRWGFPIFNDPTVPLQQRVSTKSLAGLEYQIPTAKLFGRDALNLLYIHSGWDKDATFIGYKAGHSFVHHGHYDAGHFTLFKGAPLITNSSTYGDFFAEHRLYYGIRSVAKNTLLVMRPDEEVKPNRLFKKNVSDGGQRLTMPTGSAIQSTSHWQQNLDDGFHYKGATLLDYQQVKDRFVYIASDLTAAYNSTSYDDNGDGGKVSRVERRMLYLYGEDRLMVLDRVDTTDKNYLPKSLLHTINRPMMAGLKVLKGAINNGILQSDESRVTIKNGNGVLQLDRLLPKQAVTRLVGGPDYRFYVETDGDDTVLNGHNYSDGSAAKPWYDQAFWRLEIQPSVARKKHHFLMALSPSLVIERNDPIELLTVRGGDAIAMSTPKSVTVFFPSLKKGPIEIEFYGEQTALYLVDPPAGVSAFSSDNPLFAMEESSGISELALDLVEHAKMRKLTLQF